MVASSPADDLAIYLVAPGVVRGVQLPGITFGAYEVDLSQRGGWLLELREGTDVSATACVGVPGAGDTDSDVPVPQLTHRWRATSGRLSLDVTIVGEATENSRPASLDVRVEEAVFATGDQTLPLELWTASVGIGSFVPEP
jgi:hypothetical protein